jgi:hypothetical protein
MNTLPDTARHNLEQALACVDLSWAALEQKSWQIILFGSRAAGLGDERSDWDLLCVGHGRTRRTRRIDVLWLAPEELDGAEWLTSELAGHVAHYGRWLAGEPTWTSRVALGAEAVTQKRRWIVGRLGAWERSWSYCSVRLRQRYADLLRRNLQRHALLLERLPVPPRQVLDQTWYEFPDGQAALGHMAGRAGVDSAFVLRELIPVAARKCAHDREARRI